MEVTGPCGGHLDWILGRLVTCISNTIKDWLIPVIEEQIKDIVQDVMDDLLPPVPTLGGFLL